MAEREGHHQRDDAAAHRRCIRKPGHARRPPSRPRSLPGGGGGGGRLCGVRPALGLWLWLWLGLGVGLE